MKRKLLLIFCFLLCFSFCGCGSQKLENGGLQDDIKENIQVAGNVDDSSEDDETKNTSSNVDNEKDKNSKNNKKKQENTTAKENQEEEEAASQNETDKNNKQSSSAESSKEVNSDNKKKDKTTTNSADSKSQDEKQVGDRYVTISDGSDTTQDSYQTDPVPEGQQKPVEPGEVTVDNSNSATCSLLVECSTVLNNMKNLKKGKESIIPKDGIIYKNDSVTFYEGETVSDILKREMKNNSIHLEYTFTPGFNSDYIEGIGNLYEFDCGNLSGWTYSVNSWFPNYGCSRYVVVAGDKIEWHFTCDLGKDVGSGNAVGE